MQAHDYADAIRKAYEGEIVAEGYFGRLAAGTTDERHRRALTLIATIEGMTHGRLRATAARLGISLSEAERDVRVEQAANFYDKLTWGEFVARAAREWPAYIARFEALARAAVTEDAAALDFLVEHERALVEFAHLELHRDAYTDSLAPLEAFVAKALR